MIVCVVFLMNTIVCTGGRGWDSQLGLVKFEIPSFVKSPVRRRAESTLKIVSTYVRIAMNAVVHGGIWPKRMG